MDTQKRRDVLLSTMKKISLEIEETKRRIPAHSAKPTIMDDLFNLEDEYDALQKELESLPPR